MQLEEQVTIQPVSQLRRGWLIDSQSVVDIRLARALLCIHLEVFNPAAFLGRDGLTVVVHVGEPVDGGLALLRHLI